MNLNWLTKDEFSDDLTKSHSHIQSIYFCDLRLNPQLLKKLIPIQADDYVEPWTEPGPTLKWYGSFENVFFILTSHLGYYNLAEVELFLSDTQFIDWRVFERINLFPFLVRNLTWINGHNNAEFSLFCVDSNNLEYEFYRAENITDAQELKGYLKANKFPQYLYMDEARNLNLTWTVKKENKIVARYNLKYQCERYALEMSKESDSVYIVECESDSSFPSVLFTNGKKLI